MAQIAYGFYTLRDLFNQRVNEVGVSQVFDAIQQSVDEHNRQMAALLPLFTRQTTDFKVLYETPLAARLQPLDENGRALPIRVTGRYNVAFPRQMAGSAWTANYITKQKMTVGEANRVTLAMLTADRRWMRDHILAAFFTNASWNFFDEMHGDLTIYGMANSDAVEYSVQIGADQGVTDTHYLFQAAAISDSANPFPTIYQELIEHPENGNGDVIVLVPTNLKASIEALSTFTKVADPNINPGANEQTLIGSLSTPLPGRIVGYVDQCWIVEWPSLPSNYMLALITTGERPLSLREEPEAELQGFKQVATRNDHPFYESQWLRIAGFGAWNRVGGLVYRVGTGSYAIPTGYESPMA